MNCGYIFFVFPIPKLVEVEKLLTCACVYQNPVSAVIKQYILPSNNMSHLQDRGVTQTWQANLLFYHFKPNFKDEVICWLCLGLSIFTCLKDVCNICGDIPEVQHFLMVFLKKFGSRWSFQGLFLTRFTL